MPRLIHISINYLELIIAVVESSAICRARDQTDLQLAKLAQAVCCCDGLPGAYHDIEGYPGMYILLKGASFGRLSRMFIFRMVTLLEGKWSRYGTIHNLRVAILT